MDFRQSPPASGLERINRPVLPVNLTQLLSFDEVRQKLRLQSTSDIGAQDIPLDAIVGSVGRYTDFTRDFLPRREVQPDRWANVKIAASGHGRTAPNLCLQNWRSLFRHGWQPPGFGCPPIRRDTTSRRM